MKVIITGASRGIGRGVARVLARRGHDVGLVARSAEGLAAVAAEIREQGGIAHTAVADVGVAPAVEGAMDTLIGALGGVDALVNNAGVVLRRSVLEMSPSEWAALFATNVHGVFHATRAVLPTLTDQGHGHIVNVSSISGRQPLEGGSAYAATKFAVRGFSESLFLEVRQHGVKVTTLYPGSVAADGAGDEDEWKVSPEEIGESCAQVLETSTRNCVSALEIRPLRPPS